MITEPVLWMGNLWSCCCRCSRHNYRDGLYSPCWSLKMMGPETKPILSGQTGSIISN